MIHICKEMYFSFQLKLKPEHLNLAVFLQNACQAARGMKFENPIYTSKNN